MALMLTHTIFRFGFLVCPGKTKDAQNLAANDEFALVCARLLLSINGTKLKCVVPTSLLEQRTTVVVARKHDILLHYSNNFYYKASGGRQTNPSRIKPKTTG